MRHKKVKLTFIIMPAIVVIAGVILFLNYKLPIADKVLPVKEKSFKSITVSVDQNLFFGAIDRANGDVNVAAPQLKVVGGIVPHHDLASENIARFFRVLKMQNPNINNFIVIGPNHRDIGISPAITSYLGFETPLGLLDSNSDLIGALVKSGRLNYDEENFSVEHSVKVLTPFVKNYFPKAKIVPILLTSKNTIDDDRRMALALALIIEKNPGTVVLGSIDFSHYLASDAAGLRDEMTLLAIQNNDYEKIALMNSDYLDSPPTLITLLETMRLLGATGELVLEHSNSAEILGTDLNNSTSYYTIILGNE